MTLYLARDTKEQVLFWCHKIGEMKAIQSSRRISRIYKKVIDARRVRKYVLLLAFVMGAAAMTVLSIKQRQYASLCTGISCSHPSDFGEYIDDDYEILITEEPIEHPCADKMVFDGLDPPPTQPKSVLYKPFVDARSTDTCAESLNIQKVAMLFLSKGYLVHTKMWQAWFASASKYVPVNAHSDICEDNSWKASCDNILYGEIDFNDPLKRQILFSVYVHVPPGKEDELHPMWRSKLIKHRIQPQWGTHQIIEATRELLRVAYRDPLNSRFLLVSESDIPLYDPLTFYRQLMFEQKSRVATSDDTHSVDNYRWHWRFQLSIPPVTLGNWRKSSQFFSMIRDHVHLVLNDVSVYRIFEKYCMSFWDSETNTFRVCYSDEHYFPTLLKMKGKEHQTFREPNGIVNVDWSHGGEHPMEYSASNITEYLVFNKLRQGDYCTVIWPQQLLFIKAARTGFMKIQDSEKHCVDKSQLAEGRMDFTSQSLNFHCPLTARKFKQETEVAIRHLYLDCDNKLKLLDPEVCILAKSHFQEEDRNLFLAEFNGARLLE